LARLAGLEPAVGCLEGTVNVAKMAGPQRGWRWRRGAARARTAPVRCSVMSSRGRWES